MAAWQHECRIFECRAAGQSLVWELAKNLWTKRCSFWPAPSLATVAAPKLILSPNANKEISPGDRRLFTIVIPEAAYLIWKQEIFNRWKEMMNRRLKIEKQAISAKYGRSALNKARVRKTWEGLLENEEGLPDDWTEATGVLVGIAADPPSP